MIEIVEFGTAACVAAIRESASTMVRLPNLMMMSLTWIPAFDDGPPAVTLTTLAPFGVCRFASTES